MIHILCTLVPESNITTHLPSSCAPCRLCACRWQDRRSITMLENYQAHIARLPLSKHTKRNYVLRVRQYLEWLDGSPDAQKALSDPIEGDLAVQEFRNWLLQRGSSPSTVNATLAAIDNLYIAIGLGPSKTKRQELSKHAPRALDTEEQHRLLKAVTRNRSARNRAIIMLMLHCGLRISEL